MLITCGGDEARAFAWTNLKELDFSVNTIKTLGEPLVSWIIQIVVV